MQFQSLLLYFLRYASSLQCLMHSTTPKSSLWCDPLRIFRTTLCVRDNIAHVMLAALAALDGTKAGELYGRLRAAYNPHRPPDSLPVPPLEEWQGISAFCEDFHCWWVGVYFLSVTIVHQTLLHLPTCINGACFIFFWPPLSTGINHNR